MPINPKTLWDFGKGAWKTFDPDPLLVRKALEDTDHISAPSEVIREIVDPGGQGNRLPGGFAVQLHPSGTSTERERVIWKHIKDGMSPDMLAAQRSDMPWRHSVAVDPNMVSMGSLSGYDPISPTTAGPLGNNWADWRHFGGSDLWNIPNFEDPLSGHSFGLARFVPGESGGTIHSTPFLRDYVIKGREDEVAEWMQDLALSDNPYDRHYFDFLETNPHSKDYGPLLENLSLDDVTLHAVRPGSPLYPKPLTVVHELPGSPALLRPAEPGRNPWLDHLISHETTGHHLNAEIQTLGLPFSEVGFRAFAGSNNPAIPNPRGRLLDEVIAQGEGYGGSPLNKVRHSIDFLTSPGSQRYYREYNKYHPEWWDSKLHKNIGRGLLGGAGATAVAGTYPLYSKITGYRDIEKTIEQKQEDMIKRKYPEEWERMSRPSGFHTRGAGDDLEQSLGFVGQRAIQTAVTPYHTGEVFGDALDMFQRWHRLPIAEDGTLPYLVPPVDPPGRRY